MGYLSRFLEESEITLSGIALQQTGTDLSIVSTRDLSEDDTVACIPRSCILSCHSTAIATLLEDSQIEGMSGLALVLLYETSLGETSPWANYISSLPQNEHIPLLWSSTEQSWLQGTDLGDSLHSDYASLREDYETMILPLIQSNPSVFPASMDTSFEAFANSMSLVSSRAFYTDDFHGEALVPLADAFNHRGGSKGEHVHLESDGNVCSQCGETEYCECLLLEEAEGDDEVEPEWESVSGSDEGSHASDVESFSEVLSESGSDTSCPSLFDPETSSPDIMDMRVIQSCRAGEEVFNTYGHHTNTYLLNRYGFAELDNMYDVVVVSMDEISDAVQTSGASPSVKQLEERLKFWNATGRAVALLLEHQAEAQLYSEEHYDDGEEEEDKQPTLEDFEDVEEDTFFFNASGSANPQLTLFLHAMLMPTAMYKSLVKKKDAYPSYCEEVLSGGPASPVKISGKGKSKMVPAASTSSDLTPIIHSLFSSIAVSRLSRYSTLIQDDHADLQRLTESNDRSVKKWALILQISEKRILREVLGQYRS